MVGLEGSGQPLQLSLRQGGITGRPRVPQHRGHIRVQMLREMAQNVAPFVELTALDGRERAAHRPDGRGECLRAVDHKEARPARIQAAIDEVTQERFGHPAMFGVALSEAQKPDACLAVAMTPEMGYERPDGTAGAARPRRQASTRPPTNAAKCRMSCFTLADSRALM